MKVAKLIKDLIIGILIVACIVIILGVVFYEENSLTKVIPEPEEILLSEEMEEELQSTDLEEIEEVVTKYYLDASDLKKYEKTKDYNKGKQFPFADDQTHNSDGELNDNGNFFEDDGTK